LGVASTAGLVTAMLVRPKNRAADVAVGTITGFVVGATFCTLSAGGFFVVLTGVMPIQADLRLLSQAAWAERMPPRDQPGPARERGPRPVDRLLKKYPDLREVPAGDRGRVFYDKVRADLIAGIPRGIWLGALFVLVGGVGICTAQVMAAGPLLRRRRA